MAVRKAEAVWQGDLRGGRGTMALGSGAFEGQYSFSSRFEEGAGTNPEELIGAAHAGCFAMAFSNELAKAGFTPERVHAVANVHFGIVDGAPKIIRIDLKCDASVPGIGEAQFQQLAEGAKTNCPVSRALAATEITLDAKLVQA
ncbi:MAG: Peroxiredoxin OsmC [Chloroflexi bacterium ADurb.Bin325]|nr:MAG: Peroxiredoxin OsmC [Chloroflexi bacterium ADurb.Bin325]